jgi:V/A-type H+/Na+-transporting ATPase subunit D
LKQQRLAQLERYLPTLQLKKAMLQTVIHEARFELAECQKGFEDMLVKAENCSSLLSEKLSIDISACAKILMIKKHSENIAGVDVPYFEQVVFESFNYHLFDTPPWVDEVIAVLRKLVEAQVRIRIAKEKKEALEKELREVSIRVNLFEKILIPRALAHIKKIRIFLSDQQLAAVSQAKVAKEKIIERSQALQQGRIL